MIEFIRPWWFVAVVPLVYLSWRMWQRQEQEQDWTDICDAHLLPHLLQGKELNSSSTISYLAVGWLLAVIALAGPSWQEQTTPPLLDQRANVIVFDLHDDDNIGQNRAKLAKLLSAPNSAATALVVFGDYPYLVAPLTQDLNTLAVYVDQLSPDILPKVSSQVKDRIERAINFSEQILINNKTINGEILLITTRGQLPRKLSDHQYSVEVVSSNTELGQSSRTGSNVVQIVRSDNGYYLLLLLVAVVILSIRKGLVASLTLPFILGGSLLLMPSTTVQAKSPSDQQYKIAQQAEQAYLAQNYFNAQQWWRQLDTPDAIYNRANALVQLGQYKKSLLIYQQVLELDPEFEDAEVNYQLVKEFLEQPEQDDSGENQDQSQSKQQKTSTAESLTDAQKNSQLVKWLEQVPEQPSDFLTQKLLRQHKRLGYPPVKSKQ